MKKVIACLCIFGLFCSQNLRAANDTFFDYQNYNHGYCPECNFYPCRCDTGYNPGASTCPTCPNNNPNNTNPPYPQDPAPCPGGQCQAPAGCAPGVCPGTEAPAANSCSTCKNDCDPSAPICKPSGGVSICAIAIAIAAVAAAAAIIVGSSNGASNATTTP
jgi:hypothetical protein